MNQKFHYFRSYVLLTQLYYNQTQLFHSMTHSSLKLLILLLPALIMSAKSSANNNSIAGRPQNEFSITAYCSYNTFHPSQYIADNNWDILTAFREEGPVSRLDSMNIPYNSSQLRLLMVGDLLTYSNGILKTKMPIFDKEQTDRLRGESKVFSDSIYPLIEPKIKELVSLLTKSGYGAQTYSLIFSYLLDGYIWDDGKLPTQQQTTDHGTWEGAYWAMYDKRKEDRDGTNQYGPLTINWTDQLGYWPGDKLLLSFARCIADNKLPVQDKKLREKLIKYNLVNSDGQPVIPVIKHGNKDQADLLCDEIATIVSGAVNEYAGKIASTYNIPSQQDAAVIFYHEVMWDLRSLLLSNGIIHKPAILNGEEVGPEHFSDITFIVEE